MLFYLACLKTAYAYSELFYFLLSALSDRRFFTAMIFCKYCAEAMTFFYKRIKSR